MIIEVMVTFLEWLIAFYNALLVALPQFSVYIQQILQGLIDLLNVVLGKIPIV